MGASGREHPTSFTGYNTKCHTEEVTDGATPAVLADTQHADAHALAVHTHPAAAQVVTVPADAAITTADGDTKCPGYAHDTASIARR